MIAERLPDSILRKKIFTTGQVASICSVAPLTVSKWFDSGKLKGYRVPHSSARRVPRANLVRFLRENGMPLQGFEEVYKGLLVGCCSQLEAVLRHELAAEMFPIQSVSEEFEAGILITDHDPDFIVIDCSISRNSAMRMVKTVRRKDEPMDRRRLLIAVVGDDETEQAALEAAGFNLIAPVDSVDAIVESITEGGAK